MSKFQVNKVERRARSTRESAVHGRVYVFGANDSKALRKELLPGVFEVLGLPKEALTTEFTKWSSKAGCSCGCSPGFVVTHPELYRNDVFVEVTEASA